MDQNGGRFQILPGGSRTGLNVIRSTEDSQKSDIVNFCRHCLKMSTIFIPKTNRDLGDLRPTKEFSNVALLVNGQNSKIGL